MAQILSFEAGKKAQQQRSSNPLGFPSIVLPKTSRRATSRRERAQAIHFAAKSAL